MNRKTIFTASAAAALAVAAFAGPAGAQYYKGKTMTLLIPVPGGSGLDLVARNFAHYWAKHIPGNPTIIPRNLPGGGGVKSLNFLADKGRPDGLTVNFGPWNATGIIAGRPGIRFDPQKLEFVGASHMPMTTIMRTDFGPGMKSRKDIVKMDGFKIAGRSADRSLDLVGNLALDLIGVKYKYIPGFRGMAKIKPALMQGEVQAGHSGYVGYNRFFRDTLIKQGKAMALWYASDFDAKGNPVNNPTVTEFPSFHDVYKSIYGKLPSGPKWRAYRWFRTVEAQMNLTVFAAAGSPKKAVADLRKGYYATGEDPDYIAASKKLTGVKITFTPLEQGLEVIRTFKNVTPELKAVFTEMAAKGGPMKRKKK